MNDDYLKQNAITIFSIILTTVILGTGVYLIHNTISGYYSNYHYVYFVCGDRNYCRDNEVNEMYEHLNLYLSKEGTINEFIEKIPELSRNEVESSIEVGFNDEIEKIKISVKNKDEDHLHYISNVIYTQLIDYEYNDKLIYDLNSSSVYKSVKYSDYLKYSLLTGFIVGIIVVSLVKKKSHKR